jgi:hypothetical protein
MKVFHAFPSSEEQCVSLPEKVTVESFWPDPDHWRLRSTESPSYVANKHATLLASCSLAILERCTIWRQVEVPLITNHDDTDKPSTRCSVPCPVLPLRPRGHTPSIGEMLLFYRLLNSSLHAEHPLGVQRPS